MSPTAAPALDAKFYQQVHALIEAERAEQAQTRRGTRRRKYACVQLVAPCIDGEAPNQSAFDHVECRDLSASGFSYYAAKVPESKQVIVALGPVPFVFLKAQVVRQSESRARSRAKHLIGCQFIGRFEG